MSRPNYLGIGAIKAGTTWAAHCLSAHPDIFMAHGKELHFFSQEYDKGLDWYLSKFSAATNSKAIGEYSVTYMDGSEATAKRIHEFNPDFRIIVSVRDPVERAFSQYRWEKQMGIELPNFREAIQLRPDLVTNGLYATNLQPYWSLFRPEQFFYIRQVDIQTKPEEVCRNLYAFLDVDPVVAWSSADRVVSETIQPKSRRFEDLRIRVHQAAMKYGAEALITLYGRLGIARLYRTINNDMSQKEHLSEEDRRYLANEYIDDLERFKSQTGLSVT